MLIKYKIRNSNIEIRNKHICVYVFNRRDAEFAENFPFAQSGDGDWAKTLSLRPSTYSESSRCKPFCLSSSPDKQKTSLLGALCDSAVNKPSNYRRDGDYFTSGTPPARSYFTMARILFSTCR